eukprot:SAG22_NODE_9051_length_613_cov_0.669261_1_plen_160_part_10
MKVLKNFHYQKMDTWSFNKKEHKFSCKLRPDDSGKQQWIEKMEVETREGDEILAAMGHFTEEIVKSQKDAEEKQKAEDKELEGVYKVVYENGALVRTSAKMDSPEVAVILTGQHILIDEVRRFVDAEGKFKIRMHVQNASVMVEWPLPNARTSLKASDID